VDDDGEKQVVFGAGGIYDYPRTARPSYHTLKLYEALKSQPWPKFSHSYLDDDGKACIALDPPHGVKA
jgi:hypothetical protein